MIDEQILPDIHNVFKRVRPLDTVGAGRRLASRLLGGLPWQQWLVLFGLGATIIATEVHDHTTMWQEHQSGQTLWTDPHLLMELFLFGLILPFVTGVILGRIGRAASERDEIARELELRREFVAQLQEMQSWEELAGLVVTLPKTVAVAERAWVLAQRMREDEFDQIAQWQAPANAGDACDSEIRAAACERCIENAALEGPALLTCHQRQPARSATQCTRYCLWLSLEETGKAALVFDVPPGRSLALKQMKLLDDLGDEIALAIGNTRLHYVQQHQDDAARSERLRIARDLHDTLGQNISYLRLKLEQLSDTRAAATSVQLQNELSKMLVVAEEAYEQVRDTLEELRAPQQQELEKTIRLYAAEVAQRSGFSVQVQVSGEPEPLSARRVRQLMYVVREALNNIEKHADARVVDIHLQWRDEEFSLTVRDDGRGFDRTAINAETHYGMAIMAERARGLNASLAVESTPQEGTSLTLSMRLSNNSIPLASGL